MNKTQTIRLVAKRVRKACEVFINSHECKRYDFYEQKDLACMCAVASDTLQKELKKHRIYAKFIEGKWFGDEDEWGYAHCWLEWKGYIIDITATQFGVGRKVIVTKSSLHYKRKSRQGKYRCRGWGLQQKPSKTLSKKIMVCA